MKEKLISSIFSAIFLILTFAIFTACGESEETKLYNQRCIEVKSTINDHPAEDISLLLEGAENGHVKSQAYLGICYMKIGGYEKGAKWIRKAAEAGDAMSQYNMAVCYKFGYGVSKSQNETDFWIAKAEKNGIPSAPVDLKNANVLPHFSYMFKY